MKNKLFLSLLSFVFITQLSCFAEQDWGDFGDLDRAWDGQKTITNKEFEEVMDALQEKSKAKDAKKKKKQFKKIIGGGESLHSDMAHDKEVKDFESLKKDEGLLLNIPVDILLDEKILERGYYKAIAMRDDNKKIKIQFYQAQFLKGEVEGIETQDDFGEEKIDFIKLLPFNESFMKLIFGSLDFNAYAYVPFVE